MSNENLQRFQILFRDERNTKIISVGCSLVPGLIAAPVTHGISMLVSGVMACWHGLRAFEARKNLKAIRTELVRRGQQFQRTSFSRLMTWKNFIPAVAMVFGLDMDMSVMDQVKSQIPLISAGKEIVGGVINEVGVQAWDKSAYHVKKLHSRVDSVYK